jgi:hypothetical protein
MLTLERNKNVGSTKQTSEEKTGPKGQQSWLSDSGA